LSPMTLRDLGWYERMGGQAGTVGIHDTLLLIWLGLRKYQPEMSWRKCRRLFSRRGWAQAAFRAIVQLNPTAFRADDAAEAQGDAQKQASGHTAIAKGLAYAFKWGPGISLDLTPLQAEIYLAGDPSKSVDRMHFGSKEEADAYVAKRQAEKAAALKATEEVTDG